VVLFIKKNLMMKLMNAYFLNNAVERYLVIYSFHLLCHYVRVVVYRGRRTYFYIFWCL